MANFTTESVVRTKFQVEDSTLVPSSLVTASIDDAHDELMRFLDPEVDTGNPEDGLVLGETLLAGAHLFRSLASKDAFDQKHVSIGGQDIAEGDRFAALTETADKAETQAWAMLEPYLAAAPTRTPADTTESTEVLGEE